MHSTESASKQHYWILHCVEVDAESSIHPESTAPSGYNSSSDEDNSQNASEEDTQEAGDEHSSGDQSSEP